MATFTCPDGHQSTAGDYCDVCGAPIADASAAGAASTSGSAGSGSPGSGSAGAGSGSGGSGSTGSASTPPPLPAAAAPGRTCPHCDASNVAGALFCESCGYDFTTGQLPRPLDPPSGLTLDPVTPPSGSAASATDPATPSSGSAAPLTPPAAADAPDAPASVAPAAPVTPPSGSAELPTGGVPTADTVAPWVVEIWVDADWYAGQDVPEACPSPGMPTVVVLRERSVLVGRRSISRGISPEIEISGDTGVSRRHAQLTTDGQRWWVEDLQSANGTYLGAAGKPLPEDPITPGQRVELAEDGRIYVGGWTRLVVREATPGDLIAPYGS